MLLPKGAQALQCGNEAIGQHHDHAELGDSPGLGGGGGGIGRGAVMGHGSWVTGHGPGRIMIIGGVILLYTAPHADIMQQVACPSAGELILLLCVRGGGASHHSPTALDQWPTATARYSQWASGWSPILIDQILPGR